MAPKAWLTRLFTPREDARAALRPLWHRLVALARAPAWYARLGIADTTPGRFDAITLVLALVLLRMEASPALAPAAAHLTELFVDDMDGQLRESGVGDLVVGKHVGRLMGTLGGRLGAYRAALATAGDGEPADPLAAALARNLTLLPEADSAALAATVRALATALRAMHDDALLAGALPDLVLPEPRA